MVKITTPLTLVAAGALLLAGCASTDEEVAASTVPSTIVLDDLGDSSAMGDGESDRGGITGEIVFVSDGTAQVQDGEYQTAIRYTDDTTFTQQVTVALADVTVGECAVVSADDAGLATSVTLTEATDGECAASGGFGGAPGDMSGMGDGTMPSTAPDASDGDTSDGGATITLDPSEIDPSAMPSDGSADGFTMPSGTRVSGTVTAVGDGTITIEDSDGTVTELTVDDSTTLTATEDADASAVEVGLCMTAQGTSDDSGGYDATSVTLSTPTDDGCYAATAFGGSGGPGGMGGGMPSGDRPDRSGDQG